MKKGLQFLGNIGRAVVDNIVGDVAGLADDDKGIIDLQLGTRVFNDVPAQMRSELWLSQLHRDKGRGALSMSQYHSLLSKPLKPELLSDISKDTHRTFPGHWKLSTRSGQRSLANVLRAYAAWDPEIGYAQGMNFIAGLLLAYLEEDEAFGAMTLVMHDRKLRDLFQPDMALLQVRLWQLGRLMPPDVAAHLESHAVLPVLFASSWFLTLFAGDFPMSFAARLMDLVIADGYAAPIMKVAVYIMERCKPDLLAMEDMEEIVTFLRQTVPNWPRSKLHDLLTEALAKPWTPRQAMVLNEINGAESVIEAVARVDRESKNKQQQQGTSTEASKPIEQSATSSSSPMTADTAIAKLKPLPPPGNVKLNVDQRWRPATPAMALVSTDSAKIKPMLGDVVLDPALSKQLWQYTHTADGNASNEDDGTGNQHQTTPHKTAVQHQAPTTPATTSSMQAQPSLLDDDMPTVASHSTASMGVISTTTPIRSSPFESAISTVDSSTMSTAAGGVDHQRSHLLSSDFGSFQEAEIIKPSDNDNKTNTNSVDATHGLAKLLGDLSVSNNAYTSGATQQMSTSSGLGAGTASYAPLNQHSSTLHMTSTSNLIVSRNTTPEQTK